MNSVISKWLGECRHDYSGLFQVVCRNCGKPYMGKYATEYAPDYENDESAWTQELFGRIEAAGLKGNFVAHLIGIVFTNAGEVPENDGGVMFDLIRATPAQKAQALSRAIEEGQ